MDIVVLVGIYHTVCATLNVFRDTVGGLLIRMTTGLDP
jgi:hypothetical protein